MKEMYSDWGACVEKVNSCTEGLKTALYCGWLWLSSSFSSFFSDLKSVSVTNKNVKCQQIINTELYVGKIMDVRYQLQRKVASPQKIIRKYKNYLKKPGAMWKYDCVILLNHEITVNSHIFGLNFAASIVVCKMCRINILQSRICLRTWSWLKKILIWRTSRRHW